MSDDAHCPEVVSPGGWEEPPGLCGAQVRPGDEYCVYHMYLNKVYDALEVDSSSLENYRLDDPKDFILANLPYVISEDDSDEPGLYEHAVARAKLYMFVRSLVEKQRAWADSHRGSATGDTIARIMHEGIDLIDPDKNDSFFDAR